MTPQEISDFFNQYIRGFMYNDISNATDKAAANFLVALGLSVYTEVMGGLVTGRLKKPGKASANYRAFLKYMGPYYVQLDSKINLYNRVRCGLAHEYFIKGPGVVARTLADENDSSQNVPGITVSSKDAPLLIRTDTGPTKLPPDTIAFGTRNYFRDFRQAVEAYYRDLLRPESIALVANFKQALEP